MGVWAAGARRPQALTWYGRAREKVRRAPTPSLLSRGPRLGRCVRRPGRRPHLPQRRDCGSDAPESRRVAALRLGAPRNLLAPVPTQDSGQGRQGTSAALDNGGHHGEQTISGRSQKVNILGFAAVEALPWGANSQLTRITKYSSFDFFHPFVKAKNHP